MKELSTSNEIGQGWRVLIDRFFETQGISEDDPRRQSAVDEMQALADRAAVTQFLPVLSIKIARDSLANGVGNPTEG